MQNRLPIYEVESELVDAVRALPAVIVQAPTGSGKSTQIPPLLVRHALVTGQVVVLEPRRLATRVLAARVAHETGATLGADVGYQIRFEDRSSRHTRIKFVTEGILFRQMLSAPTLPGIGAVILDEFHERHIHTDLALAMLRRLQQTSRPDLKLLVMSATLDTEALAAYLVPGRTIRSSSRQHPVTIEYLDREPNPQRTAVWDLAADSVAQLLQKHPTGDCLVFMPGAYEISRTLRALAERSETRGCDLLPLHGDLPPDRQDIALRPSNRRRVIVSTNVAETSLTIEGITLVVDSGLARIARFDPNRGMNTLHIDPISQSSAEQRAGRAGRVAPGHCLRLWTHASQATRPRRETPEIHRLDLSETLLGLRAAGIDESKDLPWFDLPEPASIDRAVRLLTDLDALDGATGRATPLGKRLAAFPVHPRYARMLLAAGDYACVPTICRVAAVTQDRSLFLTRVTPDVEKRRRLLIEKDDQSDFGELLAALAWAREKDFDPDTCRQAGISAGAARQADRLASLFMSIAKGQGLPVDVDRPEAASVARCVLSGFPDQVAVRLGASGRRCELVHSRRGDLSADSAVKQDRLMVIADVREVDRRRDERLVQLSLATAIRQEWLEELFPGELSSEIRTLFDPETRRVVTVRERRFRDLVIESRPGSLPEPEAAAEVLAEELVAGRLSFAAWDQAADQWVARLRTLTERCPELGLPTFDDAARRSVIAHYCRGAMGYKDLKSKPLLPVLREWLGPEHHRQLDSLVPERMELSNGRSAKVAYEAGALPSIALPIQSLYGVTAPVRIAKGRIPVLVHILAPSHRPVQVTQDLAGFWRNHYPQIKKELQRRYPKHEWR